MVRILVFLFVSLAISATPLQAQGDMPWTLEKCIEHAIQHNIAVKQAYVTQQLAKNENLQSKLNLLPTVDGSVNYNFNFGNSLNPISFRFVEANSQSGSANMQASLPLFTGLQQIYNMERTKYDLLASKFDFEAAQNDIALSVSSAFLQILLNKEVWQVAEKQKELTTAQRKTVESRVKSGLLPENALLEIDAQLARDEANITNAKGVYNVSMLVLKQLLQITDDKPFEVAIPQIEAENITGIGSATAGSVFEFAVNNQPSVKSALARVQSANASRKIALGALSPTLSAFGSLSTGYFSQDQRVIGFDTANLQFLYEKTPFNDQLKTNFRKVVGFSLNVPLFGRGQRILGIGNARLQQQLRELQLESARNRLRQDVEQAYANATAAADNYFANKKSVEAAQRSLDVLEKRYQNGLVNNFDLQQAKNSLAIAQSEMVRAKYNYIFRQKVIDFYMGKPIRLSEQ